MSVLVSCFSTLALGAVLLHMHRQGVDVRHLLLLDGVMHATVRIRLWCAKGLFVFSLAALVSLVPAFYKGANLYECGKPWLYSTAAYLYHDSSVEIGAAVVVCLLFGSAATCLRWLEGAVSTICCSEPKPAEAQPPRQKILLLWAIWVLLHPACVFRLTITCWQVLLSLLLSTPMVLYILSTVLPPDNTWNFPPGLLEFFQHVAAPGLYGISALVVPPLSRWAVRTLLGVRDANITVHLIIFARYSICEPDIDSLHTPLCAHWQWG